MLASYAITDFKLVIFRGDQLIPTEMAEEFDAGEFPSLEQAADMASGVLRRDNKVAATPATLFSRYVESCWVMLSHVESR